MSELFDRLGEAKRGGNVWKEVEDGVRSLEIDVQESNRRIENALSRARGLAAQNKELKRSLHEIHVAWQKEIDNRIKGENLRARVRMLLELAEDCYGVATCERSYYEELGERLRIARGTDMSERRCFHCQKDFASKSELDQHFHDVHNYPECNARLRVDQLEYDRARGVEAEERLANLEERMRVRDLLSFRRRVDQEWIDPSRSIHYSAHSDGTPYVYTPHDVEIEGRFPAVIVPSELVGKVVVIREDKT